MSEPFRVLIVGGGITGPVAAYWLARASTVARPIQVTVMERASATPSAGQGLDVDGPGRQIVKRMGLLETIKSRSTGEQGFHAVDRNSRPYATWHQGGLTQDIEIMRGDLCQVLTQAANESPNVDFRYNHSISNVEQRNDFVRVTASAGNGRSYDEEYGAVIAADGLRSRTRDLILDPADTKDCAKSKNIYVAFCSIPARFQDREYSRLQHGVRGRAVWIRPVTKESSSAYLIAVGDHPVLARSLKERQQPLRAQAWAEAFSDLQYGEFPRVMKEMQKTDNFYSDQITQIKLPSWSKGRCAVVGDAAYAPSPMTGEGTKLGFLGAYVLAGELARNTADPAAAFKVYEEKLRKIVENSQQIPLGGRAPSLVCPQSPLGIRALQATLWLSTRTGISQLLGMLPHEQQNSLPDYDFG